MKKIDLIKLRKKGQIGETMTWFVATIVVIVILSVSIFVAKVYSDSSEKFYSHSIVDILATKSFFSYLLTEDGSEKNVYEQFTTEENLNEFNGNLGQKIFERYYSEEYLDVWVGFVSDKTFLPYLNNDFFGSRPIAIRGGDINFGGRFIPHVTESIFLKENKNVELVLKVK